jgi:hypothetical protein
VDLRDGLAVEDKQHLSSFGLIGAAPDSVWLTDVESI